MENCKHERFIAQCDITRLTDSEQSKEVTGYTADLTIKCEECGTKFEFIGVPNGYSPKQPMANVDFTELRIPIMPYTGKMATNMSFTVTKEQKTEKKNIN